MQFPEKFSEQPLMIYLNDKSQFLLKSYSKDQTKFQTSTIFQQIFCRSNTQNSDVVPSSQL